MINYLSIQGFIPDIVLFFDIDPEKALGRKTALNGGDRLEKEDLSFHKKVFKGYKEIIKRYNTIQTINADRTKEEIFDEIKSIIEKSGCFV